MKRNPTIHPSRLLTFILPLALAAMMSGCTLLGLGAAAGATVGGCSLLDTDEDETITEAELSAGLFDTWDTNGDDALTEAEFEAGIDRSDVYEDWSGDFDSWDDDDDGVLSEPEFAAGVSESENVAQWMDSQCDELGL